MFFLFLLFQQDKQLNYLHCPQDTTVRHHQLQFVNQVELSDHLHQYLLHLFYHLLFVVVLLILVNIQKKNEQIIRKAIASGVEYVFTSLHIPEESGVDYHREVQKILSICKEGNLKLIVDVGPETFEKLGIQTIEELEQFGISHVRLDYGFTAEETVRISRKFHVVFNASTITDENLAEWKLAGADFSQFAACHNFYPKQ